MLRPNAHSSSIVVDGYSEPVLKTNKKAAIMKAVGSNLHAATVIKQV